MLPESDSHRGGVVFIMITSTTLVAVNWRRAILIMAFRALFAKQISENEPLAADGVGGS